MTQQIQVSIIKSPRKPKRTKRARDAKYGLIPSTEMNLLENAIHFESDTKDKKALMEKVKSGACSNCGLSYPSYCMHFHHIGTKKFQIGNGMKRSLQELIEELDNCILLCVLCHNHLHFGKGKPFACKVSWK